ncbi:MAG: hypothetical protein QOJ22_780 [Thermoleophilaceae bacterium]|nr:hypothetical protein [Thermoleophilaceae bacterium]
MAKFVLIYKGGGMADTEEEQQKQMAAWGEWFGGLGDAVVDMGNPFGASKSVGGNGGTSATGYSIVSADSLDDAVGLANGCPILANNGSVEVYEAIEM